jgi:hypothetical protein
MIAPPTTRTSLGSRLRQDGDGAVDDRRATERIQNPRMAGLAYASTRFNLSEGSWLHEVRDLTSRISVAGLATVYGAVELA